MVSGYEESESLNIFLLFYCYQTVTRAFLRSILEFHTKRTTMKSVFVIRFELNPLVSISEMYTILHPIHNTSEIRLLLRIFACFQILFTSSLSRKYYQICKQSVFIQRLHKVLQLLGFWNIHTPNCFDNKSLKTIILYHLRTHFINRAVTCGAGQKEKQAT